MTLPSSACGVCRCCREPLPDAARFCVRCGLPASDACPGCDAPISLAAGTCAACGIPLVHCATCGRNYTVDHTRCENVDWNCLETPLVSAHGTYAGQHGTLGRTSSVAGGPLANVGADQTAWVFDDPQERVLELLAAYGRAFLVTSRGVLSLPLRPVGAVGGATPRPPLAVPPAGALAPVPATDASVPPQARPARTAPLLHALSNGVVRTEPLVARGREFHRIVDAAAGFGQIGVIAEGSGQAARAFVLRADNVATCQELRFEGSPCAVAPLPDGLLLFARDGEGCLVHRFARGTTRPDASAKGPPLPPAGVSPVVPSEGLCVIVNAADGSVYRLDVSSLEFTSLLSGPAQQAGPPALGPRGVYVLTRERSSAVTVCHQIDLYTNEVDAVSLPLGTDLRLRGAGRTRLVYETARNAYRAVRIDPWPARLQSETIVRPANEEITSDLVLDNATTLDLILCTRESGRGDLRLVHFDGEIVLRGALEEGTRFAACDDHIFWWNDGRVECCKLK